MSDIKEESSPRKRGRMTFSTKDQLRYYIGENVDKRIRAEQLLQEAEEKLEKSLEKNHHLEARLRNAEEGNTKLLKTIEILVQEIKNIRDQHEKEIEEKDKTHKEWAKTFAKECQAKIDAEKNKADIEKAKLLGEIYRSLEMERRKREVATASAETQAKFEATIESSAPEVAATLETSNPFINAETSIFPPSAICKNEPNLPFVPPASFSQSSISSDLQKQMTECCYQIRKDFKNLPFQIQSMLKFDADRLALLIKTGKKVPPQNGLMSLLIADRLGPNSYNIEP